jgi:hypothetical protein
MYLSPMNIYIILGVAYLVYTIYTRFKNAKANRPEMRNPNAAGQANKPQESLLERLRRMAEEAEAQQRNAQQGQFTQQQQNAGNQGQEYPDEWLTTETGTKVHDLEGRKLKDEYLQSKEKVGDRESILEEYMSMKQAAKTTDVRMVDEYEAAHGRGQAINHRHHGHGKSKTPSTRVVSRIKKVHQLRKDLFSAKGVRKAVILSEVLKRPEY